MESTERILENLEKIFERETALTVSKQILKRIQVFRKKHVSSQDFRFSQKDIVLITYADQFRIQGQNAIKGLQWFAGEYLAGKFNTIHILPFFPYSSDDGFSVIDYYQVAGDLGGWEDIRSLAEHFRLMVDGVFNHVSRRSCWFQAYLSGDPRYRNYFIEVDPATDLSAVVRPRTLPLLTAVKTEMGERHVWTTFSDDQIDLNYADPQVFLEIIDVLLFYVGQGARVIRIDAVPFLWKQIGTDCIHRPQTHAIIKVMRAVLDAVALGVILITESNVPFEDNISYLGEIDNETGVSDEAQLVYQFSLGPLIVNALVSGSARTLSEWVENLPSPHLYFNFIASHDGIGLLPAQGILDPAEIELLIRRAEAHGGMLSYKTDTNGERQVYELNITLYDMLNDPSAPQPEVDTARFLASQVIMLELAGVPGVYVHSLFGSSNCLECVADTGRPRSINREKFDVSELKQALSADDAHAAQVLKRYLNLVEKRVSHSAFGPQASQKILRIDVRVFALLRADKSSGERILCLSNLTANDLEIELDISKLDLHPGSGILKDLIADGTYPFTDGSLSIKLNAYQSLWLLV